MTNTITSTVSARNMGVGVSRQWSSTIAGPSGIGSRLLRKKDKDKEREKEKEREEGEGESEKEQKRERERQREKERAKAKQKGKDKDTRNETEGSSSMNNRNTCVSSSSNDTQKPKLVLAFSDLVMCTARLQAVGQAKPGPIRPSQAGPKSWPEYGFGPA
jgi:hypothetical protein